MTAEITTETMSDTTPTTVTAPKARPANNRLNVVTTERRHVPKPSGKADPTPLPLRRGLSGVGARLDAPSGGLGPAAPRTPHTSASS
jgi:linoleoyl-CoA desaturase